MNDYSLFLSHAQYILVLYVWGASARYRAIKHKRLLNSYVVIEKFCGNDNPRPYKSFPINS